MNPWKILSNNNSMKNLLDTHTSIWFLNSEADLSDKAEKAEKLIKKFEADEDVQAVYHTME